MTFGLTLTKGFCEGFVICMQYMSIVNNIEVSQPLFWFGSGLDSSSRPKVARSSPVAPPRFVAVGLFQPGAFVYLTGLAFFIFLNASLSFIQIAEN